MTMLPGVPGKKRKFELLAEDDTYGACFLDKQSLYILSQKERGEDMLYEISLLNLEKFDGVEENLPVLFKETNIESVLLVEADGYLILRGGWNTVVRRSDGSLCISEYKDEIPDYWGETSSNFVFNGMYYRQVDQDDPTKGVDEYDFGAKKVVRRLDIDFSFVTYSGGGLCIGVRQNGNPAIFSVVDNSYLFELDADKYFPETLSRDYRFSIHSGRVAIASDLLIVVADFKEKKVTHVLDISESGQFQSMVESIGAKIKFLSIQKVTLFEDHLFINGGRIFGYAMALDVGSEFITSRWLCGAGKEVLTEYRGGDIVFGIEGARPVAWDAYNGEKIWEGNSKTIANKIQIGDGWLVLSQVSGYFHCYRWKKPYVSPHRSK